MTTVHKLEWTWVVRVGPFQHYMEAWETMMKIPTPEMTVVPFGDDPGKALFTAALGFDPAVSPPRIVTAASISGKRLRNQDRRFPGDGVQAPERTPRCQVGHGVEP